MSDNGNVIILEKNTNNGNGYTTVSRKVQIMLMHLYWNKI